MEKACVTFTRESHHDFGTISCMFGSAVTIIDFDRIDSVKLILVKIDFKLKWFMFGYIYVKVS
jgi:hypothetical protein